MATNGNTSTTIPKTMKAWSLEGTNGFDSLTFHGEAPLPEPSDYEVLVKFHAASLNYRDLLIPRGQCSTYLLDAHHDLVSSRLLLACFSNCSTPPFPIAFSRQHQHDVQLSMLTQHQQGNTLSLAPLTLLPSQTAQVQSSLWAPK
jgi:hypothetical protein